MDHQLGCRRPSKRESDLLNQIRTTLLAASKKNNIRLPNIIFRIQDTRETNAYAYGSNRVAFTTGMLREYAKTENQIELLAAVAAHEIGHHKNGDCAFWAFGNYVLFPYKASIYILNMLFSWLPLISYVNLAFINLINIPVHVANFLDRSISQFVEYRADNVAARLLGAKHFADVLNSFAMADEWSGGGVLASMQRSHPASELRRDKVLKDFPPAPSSDGLAAQTVQ
ncbi:M48 family metalloprotease [Cohaesibacter celericrescens]|nr:M48 family metallopeptidase [Cohaesibacter celericrescens]